MEEYPHLDEYAQDILREVGNIGAGNAMTSLSNMVGQTFELKLPQVRMVDYRDVPGLLGGAEQFEIGILLEITGGLSGIFMFLINETFAKVMLDALLGEEERDLVHMDELSRSAACEVGNVVCCAYINALARLMDEKIHVSVPDISGDMAGAILSVPMIHFANISDELLFLENQFRSEETEFTGHVLFFPEKQSLKKILKVLGG